MEVRLPMDAANNLTHEKYVSPAGSEVDTLEFVQFNATTNIVT